MIIVVWDPPVDPDIDSYRITPISAKTLGKTTTASTMTRAARFHGIPPGEFRVVIQAVASDGTIGEPTVVTVMVPGSVMPGFLQPPMANAPTKQHLLSAKPGGLSSTGAGALGLLLASGAMAGWRRARRKKS